MWWRRGEWSKKVISNNYSNDTFHFGPRGLIPARSAVGVDEFDTLIQAMNEQSRKYAMSLMNSLPS